MTLPAAGDSSAAATTSSLVSRCRGAGARPSFGLARPILAVFNSSAARPRLISPCPTDAFPSASCRAGYSASGGGLLTAPVHPPRAHCAAQPFLRLHAHPARISPTPSRRPRGASRLIFCACAGVFVARYVEGNLTVSAKQPWMQKPCYKV